MTRLSYSTALGLLVATAIAGVQSPAQPPAPPQGASPPPPEVTFRVEVNYVEEDVRVIDRDGNFVRGLSREDFALTEDGKPQTLSTFGMVDIPVTPIRKPLFMGPDAMPIERDVASNEQVLDGRLYLILMDDYHVAALRSQNAKNLARRFVLEKLGPDDQAAVIPTSGSLRGSQDFTQNRRLLLDAIENFQGQKMPSATLNRVETRGRELAQQQLDADQNGTAPVALTPDDLARKTSLKRANVQRPGGADVAAAHRRMDVGDSRTPQGDYLSAKAWTTTSGTSPDDPSVFKFNTFNAIQQETVDTIQAASRSNVQIYPVTARLATMAGTNRLWARRCCRCIWVLRASRRSCRPRR